LKRIKIAIATEQCLIKLLSVLNYTQPNIGRQMAKKLPPNGPKIGQKSAAKWAEYWPQNGPKIGRQMGQKFAHCLPNE
jgi:hypothetical protein